MTDNACKPLAAHLDERRARGLEDIKFYVHNPSLEPEKGCAEAATIFAAIEKGLVEDFRFDDRRMNHA